MTQLEMILTITASVYVIGAVIAFFFLFTAAAHIGVYWYQFNRIQTLRVYALVVCWFLAPIIIFFHERKVKKYLSMSFEDRKKYDDR